MKAVVATFNREKALVGAFSVITNLRMELFQALVCCPDSCSSTRLATRRSISDLWGNILVIAVIMVHNAASSRHAATHMLHHTLLSWCWCQLWHHPIAFWDFIFQNAFSLILIRFEQVPQNPNVVLILHKRYLSACTLDQSSFISLSLLFSRGTASGEKVF